MRRFLKEKRAAAGKREFDLDSIIHSAPGSKRECGFPHNFFELAILIFLLHPHEN
jgi:hypothetical protein